jgi:polyisoprenoid-binding protein YceI
LVVAIIMLGVVAFVIWNGQPAHEQHPLASDSSSQRDLGSGEDQGENKFNSKPAEDTDRPHAHRLGAAGNEDKPESKTGADGDKADSKAAEGGRSYRVDVAASRVYVKVGSATRLGHLHGVEGKLKSGKLSLGAGGELVFDMSSFTADTPEARQKVGLVRGKISDNEAKKVTQTMLGADVLDVEKFPTATCQVIAIKPAERQDAGAPGTYQVNGRFTLHGAEQPVQFKAKLERTDKEGILKLSGSFAIKQTAYGMRPYSAAGGLAKVADELEIVGELLLDPAR